MARLRLDNFEDFFDPDALARGRELFDRGAVTGLALEDDLWSVRIHDDEEETGEAWPGVELDRHGISLGICDCAEYDEEHWERCPCPHIAALCYALRETQTKIKAPSKRGRLPRDAEKAAVERVKKIPARKKDPAVALLDELEAADVIEFVRQTLTQSKEFKSRFLLHFADKDQRNEEKFEEIALQAIKAVRGRRKYLQGADGAKIATALAPLFKQAAGSEAKGFFREAFGICRVLLREVPKVLVSLQSSSAKLETLLDQTLQLISQIIKNQATPFEFRDAIFEQLLPEYRSLDFTSPYRHVYFERVLEAARVAKRLDEVEKMLRETVGKFRKQPPKKTWSIEYQQETDAVEELVDFYEHELHDKNKVQAVLEENKHHLVFYLRLIDHKIEEGSYGDALAHVEDIQKNIRRYESQNVHSRQLSSTLDLYRLDIYHKTGDKVRLAEMAARMFQASFYRDFRFYDLEKGALPPEKWNRRVDHYLKVLGEMRFAHLGYTHPFLEIAAREGRWIALRDRLIQTSTLPFWQQYGPYVKEHFPNHYLKALRPLLEREVQNANMSAQYALIAGLLREMAVMEGGTEMVREMVYSMRQKYGNRPALLKALAKVV